MLRAGCRLFALGRMVDVLHFNMERIYDLWGIFLAHVLEVLASPKLAVRAAAMDAVGSAINGALQRREAAAASPPGGGPISISAEERQSTACEPPADAAAGVEHMLLVALTALYTADREVDVRLGVLRVAITVLQRHGELALLSCFEVLRSREAWQDPCQEGVVVSCRGAADERVAAAVAAPCSRPRAGRSRSHHSGLPVCRAHVQRLHVQPAP